MDAKTALGEVLNAMEDYQSFTEGFDHEFHGDEEAVDADGEALDREGSCRFDFPEATEGLKVLERLIKAATAVVEADPDDLFEGKLDALFRVLEDVDRPVDVEGRTEADWAAMGQDEFNRPES